MNTAGSGEAAPEQDPVVQEFWPREAPPELLNDETRPAEFEDGPEVLLEGGDITEGLVRIGRTVRWPRGPVSEAVERVLRHLEAVGFDASPRHLGGGWARMWQEGVGDRILRRRVWLAERS